jgi:hypothetical protein
MDKYQRLKEKAEKDLELFRERNQKKYEPIIENLVKKIGLNVVNSQWACSFRTETDRDFESDEIESFKDLLYYLEDDLRLQFLFQYRDGVFTWFK